MVPDTLLYNAGMTYRVQLKKLFYNFKVTHPVISIILFYWFSFTLVR